MVFTIARILIVWHQRMNASYRGNTLFQTSRCGPKNVIVLPNLSHLIRSSLVVSKCSYTFCVSLASLNVLSIKITYTWHRRRQCLRIIVFNRTISLINASNQSGVSHFQLISFDDFVSVHILRLKRVLTLSLALP